MAETKELKATKEVETKSVDPVVVATLALGTIAAYPGAKELIKDVRKIIQKDQEEKF